MQIQKQIEETVEELRRIMGDKYYEGVGTDFTAENIIDLFRKHSNTIATKSVEESYKKALDDMFLEICKLAEPDERQPSAGDLNTNMDNIHDIRVKLSKPKE